MPWPAPIQGLVIRYQYLWEHEYHRGQVEGSKDRPAAVIVATNKGVVLVMPITSQQPDQAHQAVYVPMRVRDHLGLDPAPCWIIAQEANSFTWPGPDLNPTPDGRDHYGLLPEALITKLKEGYRQAHANGDNHLVIRTK